MGINKRNEEQMKKILLRSKLAEKKEAEQKKLAKKNKGSAKAALAVVREGDLTAEEKKKLRANYSHMVTSAESGPKPAHTEPAHSFEVHGRKNLITVSIILHKIPDQYINIDETTARKLVVDTTKYTKKLRLDFPFPKGMRVDLAKAGYTLDSGVLKCVFPIDNMPEEVAEENRKLLESVKADRQMRFKYDQNGDLAIRKRKSTLAVPPSAADGKKKGGKDNKRGKRDRDGDDSDDDGDAPAASKKGGGKKNSKDAKLPADAPKDAKKAPVSDEATLKLIQDAAKTAGQSTKKKQMEQQKRAAKTEERGATREEKSSKKKDTMSMSFSSLVAAQKKKLEERQAMALPVKPKAGPRKAVSFSKK